MRSSLSVLSAFIFVSGSALAHAQTVAPADGAQAVIVSSSTGQCAVAPSKANGVQIVNGLCSSTGAVYQFKRNADGSYSFVNKSSSLCFDIQNNSTAEGAKAIQFTCNSGANQKFWVVDLGNGASALFSVSSSKALDLSVAAGLVQKTFSGSLSSQQFKFLKPVTVPAATPTPLPSATPVPPVSGLPSVQAQPAYGFVDTLGINTRFGNTWSGQAYADAARAQSALKYIGVKYARDMITKLSPIGQDPAVTEMSIYKNTGIKFMIFTEQYDSDMALILKNLPMIAEVEGPNEIDNFPVSYKGLSNYAAGAAMQKQLFTDLRASAAGVPVDSLTIANYTLNPNVGDLSAVTDRASFHIYIQWNGSGGVTVFAPFQWGLANMSVAKSKPPVITETGWWTQPAAQGVTESAQAKYLLNAAVDAYALGSKRTMFYELFDNTSDPGGSDFLQHFGVFRFDGTAKPSALALHNLTTVLVEPNPIAKAGALSYQLKNLPASTGHQMLLQKADGTFQILVWNEVRFWDNANSKEITTAPVSLQLSLGTVAKKVQIIDPLINATGTSVANASSANVSLGDHLLIIQVTP